MTILRADVLGFCSGVRLAVAKVEEALQLAAADNVPVYTIGALIHNEMYLQQLAEQGVEVISSPQNHKPGFAVVRAHGISRSLRDEFTAAGFKLIEGTCPRVLNSQRMVIDRLTQGKAVIIAGDPLHGEVVAIKGASAIDTPEVSVLQDCHDAQSYVIKQDAVILCQTTYSATLYQEICTILEDRFLQAGKNLEIVDTICPATSKRQDALRELSEKVDAIIVVGGKESANTQRLYEIVKMMGKPVWHIQNITGILPEMFQYRTIGVTAGASTPDWLIETVVDALLAGQALS